jgi:hypothetical protein
MSIEKINSNLFPDFFVKKHSLANLIGGFLATFFVFGSVFIIKLQSDQIKDLTEVSMQLSQNQNNMHEDLLKIQSTILSKDLQIDQLTNIINANLDSKTITIDSNVLLSRNEMTKFYVKIFLGLAGVSCAVFLGVYVTKGLFSWRMLLPLSYVNYLEKFSLFQNKESYTVLDKQLEINWVVHVINKKICNIYVDELGKDSVTRKTALDYVLSQIPEKSVSEISSEAIVRITPALMNSEESIAKTSELFSSFL